MALADAFVITLNDDATQTVPPTMIARLQRALLALWLAAVIATVGLASAGQVAPAVAIAILCALLFGHALVLGIEFAWMARVDATTAGTAPSASTLVRSWIAECLHAPLVFFWRQPLRHGRWPDDTTMREDQRRGVLLVHGYMCNRGLWNRWMARWTAARQPYIALDLEPPFGSIDAYAAQIDDAVQSLSHSTGLPPLVVAHSMGGLAVRRWWAERPHDAIHHLVTLGTPHHGTRLARLAFTTNARQMREHSAWLQSLARAETAEHRRRITCVYSRCDNIVFPAERAVLEGAASLRLDATPHVAMVDHPAVWAFVGNALTTSPAPRAASGQAPCSRTGP
jgi:triacylglycerol esterase/lipase EstA (alpha/beta hydrolase family)